MIRHLQRRKSTLKVSQFQIHFWFKIIEIENILGYQNLCLENYGRSNTVCEINKSAC